MYWIYLIIFAIIVYIPSSITHGVANLSIIQTQEYAILLLGSIGFTIFIVQEKKLKKNLAEKILIQRQVNRMTKDLTHSYSYIGEINRKLDILENITLGFPDSAALTLKQKSEIYASIMGAIKIFSKCDEFSLRFIKFPKYEIVKEIKSHPDSSMSFNKEKQVNINGIFEDEDFITINSPKAIDNILVSITIRKKTSTQQFEDLDILKTLAAQALFLYIFMKRKQIGVELKKGIDL